MNPKPELLAPAGNVESFFAAVQSGADAVYLGLKKFNARETALNFTLEEISTIVPFAHKRGVRVYVALNSQITAGEVPEVLDVLNSLSSLKPDGVIAQDPGVFYLIRKWLPGLSLHASTLAAVHNTAGVKALEAVGVKRVVLARELSLDEIEKICNGTKTELEVFIHGALCYSYSGLCLASSFRGGRSGLRGQCVQPCRLRFRQGNREGFFLSCNDLCALPLIPKLKRLRIAAFKIEGRMKPAGWIAAVVKAYRSVLDAASPNEEQSALTEAEALLARSPSRRLGTGHLDEAGRSRILTPHRSGSTGVWSATVRSVSQDRALVDLRYQIAKGDRLRPESSSGKEEEAFTVLRLFDGSGQSILSAQAGSRVYVALPKPLHPGDRLFKVGTKTEPAASIWKKIREEVGPGSGFKSKFNQGQSILEDLEKAAGRQAKKSEMLVLKVGSIGDLAQAMQSSAAMVLLSATRNNLEHMAKKRFSPSLMKKIGFCLPAIIHEKEIEYFRAAVGWFIKKGLLLWEINNWAHFDLTGHVRAGGVRLIAGSRLNIRNSAAFAQAAEMGCTVSVLSCEITLEELREIAEKKLTGAIAVMVYCWPALFTSRLVPDLYKDRPFLSGRNEAYFLTTKAGHTEIYADRPMSWLEELPLLRSLGYTNFVVDAAEGPGKRPCVMDILKGFHASRTPIGHSLFNFDRRQ